MSDKKIPFRVKIVDTRCGRYAPTTKPLSWDERKAGEDIVIGEDGIEYTLHSDGDQCTPGKGWEILINGEHSKGYTWTLFGIAKV